ncbi:MULTISPECIES: cytochrome c oxidase subunit 4 [unclassified Streptomyces]|uniref:aa3-type cytochrome oxidase subunit IV n=1 Tax=unclassified Streptomyces TaxID=2593676 RepID=UPI002E131526|nr:cytochrome c oxidase subunit 4 [Streptomyces sp. NBC_01197]WSS47549.1 cytochrome c oxidase subunit 4 [Streptomyces sp. NBC_01180]
MKGEAWMFSGVSVFFGVTVALYWWFSREPAGTAALLISFLMSGLIAGFLWRQYERRGRRPEDRPQALVQEAGGRRAFFPARSYFPVISAAGAALTACGAVQGLWLSIIGVGVLAPGIFGFVFQELDHPA